MFFLEKRMKNEFYWLGEKAEGLFTQPPLSKQAGILPHTYYNSTWSTFLAIGQRPEDLLSVRLQVAASLKRKGLQKNQAVRELTA